MNIIHSQPSETSSTNSIMCGSIRQLKINYILMKAKKDFKFEEFGKTIEEILNYLNLNPPPPYVIKNKNPRENIAEMEKLEAELTESFEKLPPDAKEYYREYTEMIKEYIKGMIEYMEEIVACRDILEQYDKSLN
jgi:hypothetical protein